MKIRASEIEVATFGGWLILAFANTCEILSLLPKGRYFRRGGGGRSFFWKPVTVSHRPWLLERWLTLNQ